MYGSLRYAIDQSLKNITGFGSPFFYGFILVMLAHWYALFALQALVIQVVVELVCGAIKFIYPTKRPSFSPIRGVLARYERGSFPSIHTARVTALTISLWMLIPSVVMALLGGVLVLLVGYSRIYLKRHHVHDVVAGALLSATITLLFWMMVV